MRITDDQIQRAWARLQKAAPGAPPAHVWVSIRGQVAVCDGEIMPSSGAAKVGVFHPDISLADFAAEVQHVGTEMTAALSAPVLRAIKSGCTTSRSISTRTGILETTVRKRLADLRAAGTVTQGPPAWCPITERPSATFQIATQGNNHE